MSPAAEPVFTLATGPVGSTPATQAALAQPVLHHTDPAFRALYAETVALLREAFGTRPTRSSSPARRWWASRRPPPP